MIEHYLGQDDISQTFSTAVCTENLNSDVVMVKSAQNGR